MTLGQRIQELRKQAGLSQEGLGEALGVSRQAVSKWESDGGIPELDTLIAMSRLFGLPLGQLLGVEEPVAAETAPDEAEEEKVEAILRRYVEENQRHVQPRRTGIWPWVVSLCCAVAAIVAVTVSVEQVWEVKQSVNTLWGNVADIENIVSNVRNQVGGLSEEIRSTLEEGARLVSTCRSEVVAVDVEKQEVTLRLSATLKDYTADSRMQFLADWVKVDETAGQTASDWVTGPDFTAEVVLPMNFHTELSIRVEDAAGNIREQAQVDYLYRLHPEDFQLDAYNLLRLVDLSITYRYKTRKFGYSEELGCVELVCAYPNLVWPEKAVLTVRVNGEPVLEETLTLTENGDSVAGRLDKALREISLVELDKLELILTVTDNLGRVKEFTHGGIVNEGELNYPPMTAPIEVVN